MGDTGRHGTHHSSPDFIALLPAGAHLRFRSTLDHACRCSWFGQSMWQPMGMCLQHESPVASTWPSFADDLKEASIREVCRVSLTLPYATGLGNAACGIESHVCLDGLSSQHLPFSRCIITWSWPGTCTFFPNSG